MKGGQINLDRPLSREIVDQLTETTSNHEIQNFDVNERNWGDKFLNNIRFRANRKFKKYSANLLVNLFKVLGTSEISSGYTTISVYGDDRSKGPIVKIMCPDYYRDKDPAEDKFTLPVVINDAAIPSDKVGFTKSVTNDVLDQFLEKIESDMKNNPFGGRKRKTRKHRSRKVKKTRKH